MTCGILLLLLLLLFSFVLRLYLNYNGYVTNKITGWQRGERPYQIVQDVCNPQLYRNENLLLLSMFQAMTPMTNQQLFLHCQSIKRDIRSIGSMEPNRIPHSICKH